MGIRALAGVPPKQIRPSAAQLTDAELVTRSVAGDERAWRELVDRYKRLVFSIPRRYRFPDDQCDDVFQNVFANLLRHLAQLRDVESLPKWMITTTHRECWRLSRTTQAARGVGKTSPDSSLVDPAAPPDQLAESWERQHAVDQALRTLGGRCEQLLRAIFLDPSRPSYNEISARLGMPLGSIGPVRARCLAKLSELLPDLE